MDVLLLGAKVLAAIHTGTLKGLSCSTCTPDTKDELNCSLEDSESYVFESFDAEINTCTCPIKYITQEVLLYYDHFQYSEIFKTPTHTSKNITAREWEWTKEYAYWVDMYKMKELKADQQTSPGATQQNLSALKAQFLNKK